MASHLFAGLRVSDFGSALVWYRKLLGEPTSFPHETEAVWTVAEHGSVYVVEHSPGAGACVVLLFVDDLAGKLAEIANRGLEPSRTESPTEGARKAVFRDPDGNEIGFGGASHAPPAKPTPIT
jgi:predicted enzyme related to lactoylglutathione lyase